MLVLAVLTAFTAQISTAAIAPRLCTVHIPAKLVNEGFLEIEVSTLPKSVQKTITTKFKKATINKAFVNKEGVYKIELVNDKSSSTVYIDTDGKLVEL